MKSAIYEICNRKFRYNYDDCLVEYGFIAETEDDINIFGANELGEFVIADEIGLSKEHWEDKEARDEYLMEYCYGLDMEIDWLLDTI